MFIPAISLLVFSSVLSVSSTSEQHCQQALSSDPLNEKNWRYATDPHGSEVKTKQTLIKDERVWISFKRVPRVDAKNNSWVELIYDLPNQTLEENSTILLEYKSRKNLVVKLSQKDYGGQGDKSYAHYQYILPAQTKWGTHCIDLADFARPSWTPENSVDKGIIKENVSAIYLVPDLKDELGGEATIEVKNISLRP
ncbi:carbohydrate binding domain-containing protein [Pseudoalteromonas sp. H105]|uniref:carbohydrate binding domain-containing protein n=1 Tax=Pseudoalteromonas sp. H105 TaxID=1348393 RepID=UPI000A415945|nr:carbohydrate binding domain-containing protein [Pseudoalteromonas sp. H105]